jgi:hypothetical protein
MKYFLFLLLVSIILFHIIYKNYYNNYIHHFYCNFDIDEWCYTNTPFFQDFFVTIEVYPITLANNEINCILNGCDQYITFDKIIYYNWTCIGEPSITCFNIKTLNGFIYW